MFWTRVRLPASPLFSSFMTSENVPIPLILQGYCCFMRVLLSVDVLLNPPLFGILFGIVHCNGVNVPKKYTNAEANHPIIST